MRSSTGISCMRIFVYEHITGGGLRHEALPASLAREGDLMLRALADDLMDVPGVEVLVTRDPRLQAVPEPVITLPLREGETPAASFRRGCLTADAVWPIAPESGGALATLTDLAFDSGRMLLGSAPAAVQLCTSKRATCEHLRAAGIMAVATYADIAAVPAEIETLVIKPDDGAGCVDTRLVCRGDALTWWSNNYHTGYVLQPHLEGDALSLSLLCREGRCQILTRNRQRVRVVDGQFQFGGVGVN
jgi:predicted ATP-grasp superfamily ATP-dependent carboligase